MKRLVFKISAILLLVIFTASIFAGCESNKATVSENSDSNENKFVSPFTCYLESCVYSGEHGVTLPFEIELSDSEQSYITEALSAGIWTEYMVCDCEPEYQYKLIFNNITLYYTSEGKFYYENVELNVFDDVGAEINRILNTKLPLKSVVIYQIPVTGVYLDEDKQIPLTLTEEDQARIVSVLNSSNGWTDEITNCMFEFELEIGGIGFNYSRCGVFYDKENKLSCILSEDEVNVIKSVITIPKGAELFKSPIICSYNIIKDNGEKEKIDVFFSEEEEFYILDTLNNADKAVCDECDCSDEYYFLFRNAGVYYYHPQHGAFVGNEDILVLTQEQIEHINSMLTE